MSIQRERDEAALHREIDELEEAMTWATGQTAEILGKALERRYDALAEEPPDPDMISYLARLLGISPRLLSGLTTAEFSAMLGEASPNRRLVVPDLKLVTPKIVVARISLSARGRITTAS